MGHQDEGDAHVALQVLQLNLHLAAQLAVEGGQRLVEQQHLGLVDQGTGQGDPLLLTAGHLPDAAGLKAAKLDQFEGLIDPLVHFGARRFRPALLQAVGHIVGHVQVGKEGIMLEHHVDRAAVGRQAVHFFTLQENLASLG